MQYSIQMHFTDAIEDTSADDEFDEMFTRLLHREPPATLVADILAAVARLPLPQAGNRQQLDGVEGLIVRNTTTYS